MRTKTSIFLFITTLSVFLFYFHTLSYGVKAFDEMAIFKETYLPACLNLREMFEIISLIGLHQHFEASNIIYSNISSLRCNPFGNFLQLLIQLLFQTNPFYYHLYSLILHVINSILVFLILRNIANLFFKDSSSKAEFISISTLTLLWALHPVNVESVLLATNANIVLGHSLSLYVFYIFLKLLINSNNQTSNNIILFIVFLCALFIAEFHFMIPLIFFSYATMFNIYFKNHSTKYSLKKALSLSFPAIIATLIYTFAFLSSNTKINFQNGFSLIETLERVFWLSPQVLFHFIKLLLLPLKLSVDQSTLVKLGNSIFDPYAIFCLGIISLLLFISIISLLKKNNRTPFSFITFFLLLLSLIPFSQIIAPLYNLASERYLYFPSFIFIFGFAHFIFFILSKGKKAPLFLAILFLLLISYSTRAYIRTLDWKNSFTLYTSAVKATNNPLFKAFRLRSLIPDDKLFSRFPETEASPEVQNIAIKNLKKAIAYYKEETTKYQNSTPAVLRIYGLDPKTLLAKTAYIYAQCNMNKTNDPKSTIKILKPYINNLSDSAAQTFYASLLYINNNPDESISILKKAYETKPYSTRIILSLCDLLYIKYSDIIVLEDYCLKAFKLYPYDSYIIYALANLYRLANNHEKFAYYSYLYGLRNHSVEALKSAYYEYTALNDNKKSEKIMKDILYIEKALQKRR